MINPQIYESYLPADQNAKVRSILRNWLKEITAIAFRVILGTMTVISAVRSLSEIAGNFLLY